MIKKIEKKNFIFIIFYGILIFLIFFSLKEIKQGKDEILSLKEKRFSLEEKEKFLVDFKSTYDKILPDLLKIENSFVSSEDLLSFVKFLENIALQSKVKLEIKSSSLKEEKEKSYFIFNLSVVSPFPNLFNFLTKLEKGPYLVELKNVTLTRLEEESVKKEEGAKIGEVKANLLVEIPIK